MIPLPENFYEETRLCPRCGCNWPLSEFGIDRARPDGRNLYCKKCIREKVSIHREVKRQWKSAQRKPPVPSTSIWRMKITSKAKVELAYQKGITDRVAIQRETRIPWEELTDIIADLNDAQTIRWNRKLREFQYAA